MPAKVTSIPAPGANRGGRRDPRTASVSASLGDATARADGLDVLEPLVCTMRGSKQVPHRVPTADQLDELFNEFGRGAAEYPLSLTDGQYFSEALGQANADAAEYENLVNRSLVLLAGRSGGQGITLDELYEIGKALQELDKEFAKTKIARPLDSLHRCTGTDILHPYAKITICRTTFLVEISRNVVPFYYEKFLVAYSYLNEQGMRRSTVTPVHSHPINFEVGYFTHFGDRSCAIEQEFDLVGDDGDSIISLGGQISVKFKSGIDKKSIQNLRAVPAGKTSINPLNNPYVLAPFASERVLKEDVEHLVHYDGLFRPHQVTVMDDPEGETCYFAMDNYFGPTGRVLVFDDTGRVRRWRHHEWVSR